MNTIPKQSVPPLPAQSITQPEPELYEHARLREAVTNMVKRGYGLEHVVKITGLPSTVAERYMREAKQRLQHT